MTKKKADETMAKTIIWNRTAQDVVKSGGQTLIFFSAADADTWLARNALKVGDSKATKPLTGVTATVYDKVTVQ